MQGMLLKTTVNFCLHLTESAALSQIFMILYVEAPIEEQAFYLQSIISTCARTMAPEYFRVQEKDVVYRYREKLFVKQTLGETDRDFDVLDMITNSVQAVLVVDDNERVVAEMVQFCVKNYKKLSWR